MSIDRSMQIAYYGLPAAGILVLATLRKPAANESSQRLRSRNFQDLVVFGSELARGTVVKPGDPNYALLLKAAQTINRFLDFIHDGGEDTQNAPHAEQIPQPQGDDSLFMPELDPDLWSSEPAFWEGLADHPFLDVQFPLSPN